MKRKMSKLKNGMNVNTEGLTGKKSGEERRKQNENIINMGTWNVRGINEEGAIKNLIKEINKYDMQIIALQETHLPGNGIQEIDNHILFKSGNKQRQFGTGFILNKQLKEKVLDFQQISERLCKIRIKEVNMNLSILNIHAPTEEKDDEIKDIFYEQIEKALDNIPSKDVIIIMGDANAKIGREEIYKEITGGQSKHEQTNENGLRLIELAIERNMKIISTHFHRKDIHKGTWMIPGKNETNQIDHILIQEKHAKMITKVRTYRGADSNSDHFLVGARLKYNEKKKKKQKRNIEKKYNVQDLQREEIATKYANDIEQNFTKLEQKSAANIEEGWKQIEHLITGATERYISQKKPKERKKWLDEECEIELKQKKIARMKMVQNRNEVNIRNYNKHRKKVKQLCRKKKREFLENQIKHIEEEYQKKDIRNFYKDVKRIRTNKEEVTMYLKDKDGNLIGDEDEKLGRWKQYFEQILNDDDNMRQEHEQLVECQETANNETITIPTKNEIIHIINMMKNNKSPGINGITKENIEYGGDRLKDEIYKLICQIWETEKMPDSWREAVIIPLFKKGDRRNCENYRGIALLDVTYKILASVLKRRLEEISENILGEYQGGFRRGRGTTDQIFNLKQIMLGCYEYDIPAHILFIDFKRAYDTINRTKLINVIRKLKIPEKLVRLIKMTLQNTSNRVKCNGRTSDSFEVRQGLRQGDPLSTSLFDLALESIIRDSGINRKGILFNRSHQCLAYADDVVLIARSRKELEDITLKLMTAAGNMGLYINIDKTKYMEIKNKCGNRSKNNLQVQNQNGTKIEFKGEESFMYLGVLINNKCQEEDEINLRIAKSNNCAGGLSRILKSKEVSRHTKIRVYKTIIRPTLTYSCETWIMTNKIKQKLETWERRILRRIFGGRQTELGWERRSNAELYELFRDTRISNFIKMRRMQWLGHLERMVEGRDVRSLAWKIPEGKRKRGRPRKRWRDAIEEDLAEKGIQNWKTKAMNRKEWKHITKLWT